MVQNTVAIFWFTNSAWTGLQFHSRIVLTSGHTKICDNNKEEIFFDVIWVFVFLVRLLLSPEPTAIRCQSIADKAVSIGNTESVNSRKKAKHSQLFRLSMN